MLGWHVTLITWKKQCANKQRMAAYEPETLTEANKGVRPFHERQQKPMSSTDYYP